MASLIEFARDPDHRGATKLNTEILLPQSVHSVFDFFAEASNLESITPPSLRFRITTPKPIPMHTGTLIDYRLRLHHIPIRWRTKISDWNPPCRFVDSQIRGPYRRWVHTHEFSERDEGTLVRDSVSFIAPGGRFIRKLFVQPELARIFQYRHDQLAELLGTSKGPLAASQLQVQTA